VKRALWIVGGLVAGWLVGQVAGRLAVALMYPGILGALTIALDPNARRFATLLSGALVLAGMVGGVVVAVRKTRP
jgi:disulfide bond formation protein DsbB